MAGSYTHGGHLRVLAEAAGCNLSELVDFSANINPLGPPEWLRAVIAAGVSSLVHYPDPDSLRLRETVAERYGARVDEVLAGNGSTELLYLLPRALGLTRAIVSVPCYLDYARAAIQAGAEVTEVPLREEQEFAPDAEALAKKLERQPDAAVFVGHPNNPTGRTWPARALRELAARYSRATFVVDEAFGDFVEGFESLAQNRPSNVIVLLSLTKAFAIPGLRLGCALADKELAQRVVASQPPWSVNSLAQAVGAEALRDVEYLRRTRAYVHAARERLRDGLRSIGGLRVYPGEANYLLARIEDGDAADLATRLLRRGLAIRVCENFAGLDRRYFRVAVRVEGENTRLLEALDAQLHPARAPRPRQAASPRTPALMFQGLSSNAGKSVLTAALCRILMQDGHRVAPFKAQNMSLNSFVTRDGGEMGRAQVVQAQACRLEPDVRMNPVLLKPNSDTGSQVIVLGQPVGNMKVAEYIRYKPKAFEAVKRAYDELAAEHDVIVLEGAGSPGEVNLKRHDIVNMQMARYAEAPVLLVGDIDRGGVYASFVGTMEVLAEWERAMVAGFVVNRFRGQASLLADAHEYVLRHTGQPVLGVVPYLRDLGLPEEDSVSFKAGVFDGAAVPGVNGTVSVAVVDLPHISNFTDFDALRLEPDVRVTIVRSVADLDAAAPDAVILPGSKNVIRDLEHLRANGIAQALTRRAANGNLELIGICGGFQMLGECIEDPHGLEVAAGARCPGLALLPVTTTLAAEKTLVRAEALHLPSGKRLRGYEIHHGRTAAVGAREVVRRDDGEGIGLADATGRIWGTYLHGLFDADEFRRAFADGLRERRGLPRVGQVCARFDIEPALDRLAETVRRSLDMNRVMALLKR